MIRTPLRLLLCLTVLSVVVMAPSAARAESCGMAIINEAFANDYTVPSYHTQACYRQANDLLAADTTVGGYLNELGDGIRAAMARDRKADLDRLNGGTTSKPADEERSTQAAARRLEHDAADDQDDLPGAPIRPRARRSRSPRRSASRSSGNPTSSSTSHPAAASSATP